jgi:hypothetical protein
VRHAVQIVVLVVCIAASTSVSAADVYVVQGYALGPYIDTLFYVTWITDAFLYNSGTATARVRLLGVSNGPMPTNSPLEITVPAQTSASLSSTPAVFWRPGDTSASLWVLHLDVPDSVKLEDVMFIGEAHRGESDGPSRFGKLRLPVFTSLTPAGQPQYHLASFLGDPSLLPSRTNVTIYNAAADAAGARIEIRSHCDDSVVFSTSTSVPANTVVQVTGLPQAAGACSGKANIMSGATYTVVTVDRPSFTFVSNLSNRDVPLTSISVSN